MAHTFMDTAKDIRHIDGLMVFSLTINPTLAEEMLLFNKGNRKERLMQQERYARDMMGGRWVFNGETIIFSNDGVLLNGQNRLKACIMAGTPFKSLVVVGVKREAQLTMDSLIARNNCDALHFAGIKNTHVLASALAWIERYDANRMRWPSKTRLTSSEVVAAASAHQEVQTIIGRFGNFNGLGGGPSIHVAMYYILSRVDAEFCESFYAKLTSGEGLYLGDPVLALRNNLLDRTRRYRPQEIAERIIVAWNAVRDGKTLQKLNVRYSGDFPEPR